MSDVTSLKPLDLPLDQVDREWWWTMIEVDGGIGWYDTCMTHYHIKITFPPPNIFTGFSTYLQ
jgi:hypothetical protein